jgi:hypothetical protein
MSRYSRNSLSTNDFTEWLRLHSKQLIIGGVILAIVVAIIFVPWGKVGESFAEGAGMPDQGEEVTAEQMNSLTNDGLGKDLADGDYIPLKTLNNYLNNWYMPSDLVPLHGVVTLWTYCPGYGAVVSHCTSPDGKNAMLSVEHPDVITTSKWDNTLADKHTEVRVAGIIIPAKEGTVRCLAPALARADSPLQAPDLLKELGSMAHDGYLHELTFKTTLEDPWKCKGF